MDEAIRETVKGVELVLRTAPEIFSPSRIDAGTLAMLSLVELAPEDKVLDLGCGCGVVGILAAKLIGPGNVVMCDISGRAVEISLENAALNGVGEVRVLLSDGLSGVPDRDFTLVLSNPPYHEDFSVPKSFIEGGYKKLSPGGRLVMVTKRREWYKNKLISVFGGVTVHETGGYYVFVAEKRAAGPGRDARKAGKARKGLSRKLRRKHRPTDLNI